MDIKIYEHLQTVRNKNPLIHNITNYVVMNNTANALLAIGASPAMVHAVEEVEGFTAISSALVINIGTLSSPWIDAMIKAAAVAEENHIPWVLDPVGVGATKLRMDAVKELLKFRPAVIRGNASEILTVAGSNQATGKGVDSTAETNDARQIAKEFAAEMKIVCAITGAQDYITDGNRECVLENGHPMMAKVTGMGCTSTALVGAFLGGGADAYDASVAGISALSIAGEMASETAKGPGSLQVQILDNLYRLTAQDIKKRLKINDSITAL